MIIGGGITLILAMTFLFIAPADDPTTAKPEQPVKAALSSPLTASSGQSEGGQVSVSSGSRRIVQANSSTPNRTRLKSAAQLSPQEGISAPGSNRDLKALLEAAESSSTAQLSVYRWWDYCQQHENSPNEKSGICLGITVDTKSKREMLIRAATSKDWRSIDYLLSEYAISSYGEATAEAVKFREKALNILMEASAAGVAEGARAISMIYYNGIGVQKDPVVAYAYLDRFMAGQDYDSDAQAVLDRLRSQLRQGDWERIKALQKGMP